METPIRSSAPTEPQLRRAQWYERYIERRLPRYAVLTLPLCLFGTLLYDIANRRVPLEAAYNVMLPLDEQIPLRAEWIVVYFGAYVFWVVNYWLIMHRGRERWFRFLGGFLVAAVVCFVVYLVFPTTMTRPEITGKGVLPWLMRFLYAIDRPLNLAPSMHCLGSWLCAIGLHSDRRIPLWYRVFSYVFALMVCASTLLVRQHCIVDVVTGVVLAQIVYMVFRKGNLYRPLMRLFEKLEHAVFG